MRVFLYIIFVDRVSQKEAKPLFRETHNDEDDT